MYFLTNGEAEVMVRDEIKILSHVRVLKAGSIFGEVALMAG